MLRLNGIESEMEEKKSQSTTSKLSKRGSILFLKANKLVRLQKSKDLDKTVESVANGSGRSSARKKRKKPYLTNVQAVRSSTTNAATSSNDNNNNASKLEQSSKDELEDVSSKLAPTSLPYHGKLSRTVNNKEGEEVEEEEEVEVDADADAEPVSGITTFSSREVEDLPEADIDRPEARLRLSLPPGRLQRSYSGRIKNPSNENSPHKETPHESAVPSAGTGTGTGSSLGMSPRKQSIMRYKQIDDDLDNTLISEAKGNLRNSLILEDSNISAMNTLNNPPPTLNLDDKVSIFIYHTSKVLVYHEQAQTKHGGTTEDPKTSGRLLGHGTLEIFQLHNGDVTYLSCGSSFVYPLLPKLKILRISFDTFILPLVNPERYWKILVETGEEDVIAKLEAILKDSVKYTNLYFGPPPTPVIHSKKSDRPHITKVVTDSAKPEKTTSIDNDEIITTTDTVQNLFHSVADIDRAKHKLNNHSAISHIFENSGTVNGNLSSSIPIAATTSGRIVHPSQQNYDHTSDLKSSSTTPAPEYPSEALIAMSLNISDIPDSPPSAPMSPSQVDKLQAFDITPSKLQNGNSDWSIKRQASTNSFTTNIACLDINDSPNLTRHYTSNRIEPPRMTVPAQYNIQQPKPQRMKNPNSFAGQLKHPHYNDSNHSSQLQLQNQNQLQHKKQQQYNRINTAVSNHDDGDSSDSSMDSLIDEYEENISTTKSIHLGSRPPSRAQSRASTNYNANGGVQYNRPAYFQGKIDNDDEDFPSTSLSEYNRVHNGGETKSRRSSRSGIEWSHTDPSSKLVKSRSTYSIASSARGSQYNGSQLSNTYREIYKSIAERNLAQKLDNDDTKSQKQHQQNLIQHDLRSKHPPLSKSAFTPVTISTNHGRYGRKESNNGSKYANSVVSDRPGGMSSSEVYKMLSLSKSVNNLRKERVELPRKEEEKGFTSRIFGW